MNRIQRAGDVFTAPLDDVLLMLNARKGKYHSLNDVAARIWDLLEQPTSEQALIDTLLSEYDVDHEQCAQDVAAFLAALRDRGLLVEPD